MQMILQWILFFSLMLMLYNYFLYPLLIYIWAKYSIDPHSLVLTDDKILSTVTMIIAAYNEEKVIDKKIKNTLELDYPAEKLQIIVVSDGSDDRTPDIVSANGKNRVMSMFQPERQGKSAALNRALKNATGEIILFSDANNDFSRNAVKQLVKHFNDENVGAVTGAKHIYQSASRESALGDGLYWKYEALIKKAESKLGSITGAEGEILAVRKNLLKPIDSGKINDDQAITFDIVKAGYRILYEENARSLEDGSIDIKDDINVKVRMAAGSYQTIKNEYSFLFPPVTWFAFTFFSHKILRWLAPLFMLFAFLSNLLLLSFGAFIELFILQLLFYLCALYGWFSRKQTNLSQLFYIPMYFTVMNFALFQGLLAFINGSQGVNWKKASR